MKKHGWEGLDGNSGSFAYETITGRDATYLGWDGQSDPSLAEQVLERPGSTSGVSDVIAATSHGAFPGGGSLEVDAWTWQGGRRTQIADGAEIVGNHLYEVVDTRGGLIGLRNPWGPGNDAGWEEVFYVTPEDFDRAYQGIVVAD
jgi:hypothetical protein